MGPFQDPSRVILVSSVVGVVIGDVSEHGSKLADRLLSRSSILGTACPIRRNRKRMRFLNLFILTLYAYAASKAVVIHLMHHVAVKLIQRRITVNVIATGIILVRDP